MDNKPNLEEIIENIETVGAMIARLKKAQIRADKRMGNSQRRGRRAAYNQDFRKYMIKIMKTALELDREMLISLLTEADAPQSLF